jgi:hypothetical protein
MLSGALNSIHSSTGKFYCCWTGKDEFVGNEQHYTLCGSSTWYRVSRPTDDAVGAPRLTALSGAVFRRGGHPWGVKRKQPLYVWR